MTLQVVVASHVVHRHWWTQEGVVDLKFAGDSFGEAALLAAEMAECTVRAHLPRSGKPPAESSDSEDCRSSGDDDFDAMGGSGPASDGEQCQVWRLHRATSRSLLARTANAAQLAVEKALAAVPLLASLTAEQRSAVALAARFEHFAEGDVIIARGSVARDFYMIESGEVTVHSAGNGGDSACVVHGPGEWFGERALLRDAPRASDVVAKNDVTLMALDRSDFTTLLGPLRQVLERSVLTRALRALPVLCDIDAEQRQLFVEAFASATARDGDVLQRRGAPLSRIVVIDSGDVTVEGASGDTRGEAAARAEAAAAATFSPPQEQGSAAATAHDRTGSTFNRSTMAVGSAGMHFGSELLRLFASGAGGSRGPMLAARSTVTARGDVRFFHCSAAVLRRLCRDTGIAAAAASGAAAAPASGGAGTGEAAADRERSLSEPLSRSASFAAARAGNMRAASATLVEERGPRRAASMRATKRRDNQGSLGVPRFGDDADVPESRGVFEFTTSLADLPAMPLTEEDGSDFDDSVEGSPRRKGSDASSMDSALDAVDRQRLYSVQSVGRLVSHPEDEEEDRAPDSFELLRSPSRPSQDIALEELQLIELLGEGLFGKVRLVRHVATGHAYALKELRKARLEAAKQQTNVINERTVLYTVQHPFVLRLYRTFRTDVKLFMLYV